MALKQKLLVLGMVVLMALALLVGYAASAFAAAFENAFALGLAAAFIKIAALVSGGWSS